MTTSDHLADIAAELRAARKEVKIALTLSAHFVQERAREGDAEAATIAPLVARAYDRLVGANLLGATAVAEAQQQER
jgi:hypothetical protein